MTEDNQQSVWQVIVAIPAGKVASYGQVADLAGLPRAARWVGRLLKNLPADSTLPWHRVVRADGRLAFATGSERYQRQQQRLRAEGVLLRNNKINRQYFQY